MFVINEPAFYFIPFKSNFIETMKNFWFLKQGLPDIKLYGVYLCAWYTMTMTRPTVNMKYDLYS